MLKPDVIEVLKDLIPYRFKILLGSELFELQLNYNATVDLYTVDLYKDGSLVCAGEPVVYGVTLWKDVYKAGRFPAVDILPIDPSGESDRVTFDNLGETVLLTIDNSGGAADG